MTLGTVGGQPVRYVLRPGRRRVILLAPPFFGAEGTESCDKVAKVSDHITCP